MSWPARKYPSAIDRLLSRCEQVGDCWVYRGPTDRKGYVRIRVAGGTKQPGHRITWEFFIGPWPEKLTFDHLCKTPSCVNPWHGDPTPSSVNASRNFNADKDSCPKGHPYAGDNLKVGNYRGRFCRVCSNESNRAYRARKAVA